MLMLLLTTGGGRVINDADDDTCGITDDIVMRLMQLSRQLMINKMTPNEKKSPQHMNNKMVNGARDSKWVI